MRILCNKCGKGFEAETGKIVSSTILCNKCASKYPNIRQEPISNLSINVLPETKYQSPITHIAKEEIEMLIITIEQRIKKLSTTYMNNVHEDGYKEAISDVLGVLEEFKK